MNYIKEINAFYNEIEVTPLSASAIALWYALLHICNRTGWKREFSVPVGTLSLKSGLSERSVSNARNELKTKGFIEFKSRGGNKAAVYQLKLLSAIIADNASDNLSSNLSDSLSVNVSGNASALVKQNKTKQTEREIARAQIAEAYEQVCGPLREDPRNLETILDYFDRSRMDMDLVIYALRKSSTADYPMKYANRILYGWERKGIKTVAEAIQEPITGGASLGSPKGATGTSGTTNRTQRTRTGDTPGAY